MFGENKTEYYNGQQIPVYQSPKYEQSKKKALEIIEKYDNINEGDFWILMNLTKKKDKMMYTGLIISHNGCLKINEAQPKEKKFKPSSVLEVDKNGYGNSLVFTYCDSEQGIYEVGEASAINCKNSYPYAMAFKRLFDRVVLKLCGLAFDGVYSDSEADEFKEPDPTDRQMQQEEAEANKKMEKKISKTETLTLEGMINASGVNLQEVLNYFKVTELGQLTKKQYAIAIGMLPQSKEKGVVGTK